MKKLCIVFVLLCIVISFTSCAKPEYIYSEKMKATGIITKVHHEPASSQVVIDYKGKISTKNIPESFEVKIDWGHGPTILDTEEEYDMYKKHKNESVTITYREFHIDYYDESGKLVSKSSIEYKISNIQLS